MFSLRTVHSNTVTILTLYFAHDSRQLSLQKLLHLSKLAVENVMQRLKLQLIDTIESNPVTVIEGPTGSGKTTQVPQYILDHYAQQQRHCNIVVTQPRRIAAISVTRR